MKGEWSPEELVEKWSLRPNETQLITSKRGATRLGFALLLKFFQLEGRFPKARNELPAPVVDYVAEEVGVTADCYAQYDWHGRAIKYHRAQIRAFSGFRRPTLEDGRRAVEWLVKEVLPDDQAPERLRESLHEWFRSLSIEPATTERAERIIRSAVSRFENEFATDIRSASAGLDDRGRRGSPACAGER